MQLSTTDINSLSLHPAAQWHCPSVCL